MQFSCAAKQTNKKTQKTTRRRCLSISVFILRDQFRHDMNLSQEVSEWGSADSAEPPLMVIGFTKRKHTAHSCPGTVLLHNFFFFFNIFEHSSVRDMYELVSVSFLCVRASATSLRVCACVRRIHDTELVQEFESPPLIASLRLRNRLPHRGRESEKCHRTPKVTFASVTLGLCCQDACW